MPFNYQGRLDYQPINPQIIEGASKSPFSIAGEAMTNLDNAIEDRRLEEKLGQAKSLEDIMGLQSKTEAGSAMLDRSMRMFDAKRQNELFQMQKDLAPFQMQKAQAEALQATNEADLYQSSLDREMMRIGATERDLGLPKLGGGKFDALSQVTPRAGFDALTQAQDAKTLGRDITVGKDRKPTSFEERDRWYNEAAGLKSLPTRTPSQQARLDFLNTGILGFQAGTPEVREGRDVSDFKQVKKIGDVLLSGGKLDEGVDRYADELGFKDTKAYNSQLQKKEQEFFNQAENLQSLDTLSARMEEAIATGNYDTGILASAQVGIAKMTPSQYRNFVGMSNEQIMEQVGLEGQMGSALADYLKSMSGTAASEAEAKRRLNDMFGGDWSQQDVKANIFSNFISKEREKTLNKGKSLVKRGLVGDVYDTYKSLETKPKTDVITIDTPTPTGYQKVRNKKTGEMKFIRLEG